MFSDNKTTPSPKRCSQKRGIIPAARAYRPTPVISRRKSVGKVNPLHQNPTPSIRKSLQPICHPELVEGQTLHQKPPVIKKVILNLHNKDLNLSYNIGER